MAKCGLLALTLVLLPKNLKEFHGPTKNITSSLSHKQSVSLSLSLSLCVCVCCLWVLLYGLVRAADSHSCVFTQESERIARAPTKTIKTYISLPPSISLSLSVCVCVCVCVCWWWAPFYGLVRATDSHSCAFTQAPPPSLCLYDAGGFLSMSKSVAADSDCTRVLHKNLKEFRGQLPLSLYIYIYIYIYLSIFLCACCM
jgi:hypothetical protein